MNAHDAADALSALNDSRSRLAAAAHCPPERHLAFCALMGGLIASQAATPVITIAIEVLLFGGLGLVILWDKRRTGMFINGYRAGRTRPLTLTLLAICLSLLGLGVWLKHGLGVTLGPVYCGGVAATVSFVLSLQWQKIYRRELNEAL